MTVDVAPAAIGWGEVVGTARRVAVLACGPSVRGLDLAALARATSDGIQVILVNRAIGWLPMGCAAGVSWFTLDPDPAMRAIMAHPAPGVAYYAAVPDDYGQPNARWLRHRAPAEPAVSYLRRLTGDGPWQCHYGLSDDPRAIHTGNSAWGGLGVAWHKVRAAGDARIALFGVDGTDEPYAYGQGRPRRPLDHLPDLFASALPQLYARGVEVINGSAASLITCFPRSSTGEALAWLTAGAGP
ncbi:MAG TPA: hypothetical protein VGB88_06225 [Alphaproteobacteria bacterium]